jgi:hypothetical protein
MVNYWQVLFVNPPLQILRSLDRTWYDFLLEEIQPFGDTNFAITNPHYQKDLRIGKRVNLLRKSPTLDNLVHSDFERVDYIGVS